MKKVTSSVSNLEALYLDEARRVSSGATRLLGAANAGNKCAMLAEAHALLGQVRSLAEALEAISCRRRGVFAIERSRAMNENKNRPQFLTIAEKREWLARIFRDTTGEYTDADKFKAMAEDTRLLILGKLSTRKEQA